RTVSGTVRIKAGIAGLRRNTVIATASNAPAVTHVAATRSLRARRPRCPSAGSAGRAGRAARGRARLPAPVPVTASGAHDHRAPAAAPHRLGGGGPAAPAEAIGAPSLPERSAR